MCACLAWVHQPVSLRVLVVDADGLVVCREIGERSADVVIVVVTVRTDVADAVRVPDGGADDFVLKPFRPIGSGPVATALAGAPGSVTWSLHCGPRSASC